MVTPLGAVPTDLLSVSRDLSVLDISQTRARHGGARSLVLSLLVTILTVHPHGAWLTPRALPSTRLALRAPGCFALAGHREWHRVGAGGQAPLQTCAFRPLGCLPAGGGAGKSPADAVRGSGDPPTAFPGGTTYVLPNHVWFHLLHSLFSVPFSFQHLFCGAPTWGQGAGAGAETQATVAEPRGHRQDSGPCSWRVARRPSPGALRAREWREGFGGSTDSGKGDDRGARRLRPALASPLPVKPVLCAGPSSPDGGLAARPGGDTEAQGGE